MAITDFERYPLMFGPSPVHPLPRLSEHLGGAQIWAKREDVNSGLAFGGNKTRKLEYIVPDALAQGADTLVSIGGYQSNHTRQVAAVAAHLGLKARLVQEKWVDWQDPVNDRVGNILLSRIMGADVRLDLPASTSASAAAGRTPSTRSRRPAARRTRSRPAPPTTGWAGWASPTGPTRWPQQERELGVFFDTIVVCTVTGSTHAGMIAGFAGQDTAAPGDRHRRLGDAGEDPRPGRADRPEHRRADRAGPRPARRRDHRAGGLGRRPLRHPGRVHHRRDPPGRPLEGMIIDPVYEGKSMAGLIDLVSSRRDPGRQQRALRPPRRPARAQRLQRALPRPDTAAPAAGPLRRGPPPSSLTPQRRAGKRNQEISEGCVTFRGSPAITPL